MSTYADLIKYIGLDSGSKRFIAVNTEEIGEAEKELGFKLPNGLKQFYEEVGFGWYSDDERNDLRNLVIHPLDIVDLYNNESEFNPPEEFLKGDLPIFDCGGDRFLVTRPFSDEGERIYRDDGSSQEIAKDFEELIEKLRINVAFYE